MEGNLIRLFVPSYILEHFDYEHYEDIGGVIRIHLVEKHDASRYPKSIRGKGRRSLNGYMNPIELQTLPTQGKEVFYCSNVDVGSYLGATRATLMNTIPTKKG